MVGQEVRSRGQKNKNLEDKRYEKIRVRKVSLTRTRGKEAEARISIYGGQEVSKGAEVRISIYGGEEVRKQRLEDQSMEDKR